MSELMSALSVSAAGVWLMERWSIVAQAPLDELTLELNLDGVGQVVAGDVLDVIGADLSVDALPVSSSGRPVVGIWLPNPLGPEEGHVFGLSATIPRSLAVSRHVVVPMVPCRRLQLRVRFMTPAASRDVVRIEVPPGGVAPPPGSTADLEVDRAGELTLFFEDLEPGGTYGVSWTPEPKEPG